MTTLNSSPAPSRAAPSRKPTLRGVKINIPVPFDTILSGLLGAVLMACFFLLIARNAERENRKNDAAFLRAIQIAESDLNAEKYDAVMRNLQILTQATAGDIDRIEMVNTFSDQTILGIIEAIDPLRAEQLRLLIEEDEINHAD